MPGSAATWASGKRPAGHTKTARAAEQWNANAVIVAGGVSANQELRHAVRAAVDLPVVIPPVDLCTDNAAMIAAAGYWRFQAGERAGYDLDVIPNLQLG